MAYRVSPPRGNLLLPLSSSVSVAGREAKSKAMTCAHVVGAAKEWLPGGNDDVPSAGLIRHDAKTYH